MSNQYTLSYKSRGLPPVALTQGSLDEVIGLGRTKAIELNMEEIIWDVAESVEPRYIPPMWTSLGETGEGAILVINPTM